MPTVHHPRALADVDGHPPATVSVYGDSYSVTDGAVDLPSDSHVEALAAAYDRSPDALRRDDADADAEVCGAELSAGGTCDRPADECPYHGE